MQNLLKIFYNIFEKILRISKKGQNSSFIKDSFHNFESIFMKFFVIAIKVTIMSLIYYLNFTSISNVDIEISCSHTHTHSQRDPQNLKINQEIGTLKFGNTFLTL